MDDKLTKSSSGFRNSYDTQHSLLAMLEKGKELLVKENTSLLYLWTSQNPLILLIYLLLTKLNTYWFSTKALNLMHSYLIKNRKQKVWINYKFSLKKDINAGVPQRSIDGLLLFNLFINDLVLFIQQSLFSNYAEDNNLFALGQNKEDMQSFTLTNFRTVRNCLYRNFMILNYGKCHYMSWQNVDDNGDP